MSQAPACFLGLDLGTSGCRAVLIDEAGAVRASGARPLPAPTRHGPCIEQWPAHWWEALVAVLRDLGEQAPLADVRALALDATSSTLLLADADGRPLAPALMYNDARAVVEAEAIAVQAPRETAAHGASSGLAKLLWLQQQAYAGQARWALHQADWLVGRLTGRWGISDSNNCLKLGYDPVGRCWPDWLARLGVQTQLLPRVLAPGTRVGPLHEPIARSLGLPADTQVVAGTTDSTAAVLATGAREVGDAVTSLGSTLVMKVVCAGPLFAPEFGVYSQPLGERWLAGGGSNSGGAVLRAYFSDAELASLTPLLRPDEPTGLDYYPLLTPGERFPINDPTLPPRLSPRPDQSARFLQGLLEGMARIELQGYQRLAALGAPYPTTVRSIGGGAGNPAWTRMRAHLLGVPVLPAEHIEAAYGAAMLARQAMVDAPD